MQSISISTDQDGMWLVADCLIYFHYTILYLQIPRRCFCFVNIQDYLSRLEIKHDHTFPLWNPKPPTRLAGKMRVGPWTRSERVTSPEADEKQPRSATVHQLQCQKSRNFQTKRCWSFTGWRFQSPKNRILRDRDTSLNKTQFQTPGNEHRISETMTCHDPGWWLTYPSEKSESQMGLLFPIYGKS